MAAVLSNLYLHLLSLDRRFVVSQLSGRPFRLGVASCVVKNPIEAVNRPFGYGTVPPPQLRRA